MTANLIPHLPALIVPANFEDTAKLAVFDGYPPNIGEIVAALTLSNRVPQGWGTGASSELSSEETGAPFGPFVKESYRVARAVGLVSKEVGGAPISACIAQGICYATWELTSTANFLVVTFAAPSVLEGAEKYPLSQEFLKARCLKQYAHQALSLLENIADLSKATAVLVEYAGDWGPETENVRRGLAKTCLLKWHSAVLAGARSNQAKSPAAIAEVAGAL